MLSERDIASMKRTLNPLTNATLLEIAKPGPSAPNGDPDPDSRIILWSGRADGYLEREDAEFEQRGGTQERQERQLPEDVITFTLLSAEGAPVLQEAGPAWEATTVVIEDRRLTPATSSLFTVEAMEHDMNNLLDSVHLVLDGQRPVPAP